MRLTLRTLLAYLDDTLEPTQTKELGTKIAENEEVQTLIERLRRISRRRGLAAPDLDSHDETTDPNTVAEYLDNELKPEQVVDVETAALDDDGYLAEIVSCHQILTLFLGEPAKVPPLARMRMYRLVTGPGSIPGRKPIDSAVAAGAIDPMESSEEHRSMDEALLMGMPRFSRGSGRLRRSLAIVAGLALAVALCIVLLLPNPTVHPGPMYIVIAPTVADVRKVVPPTTREEAPKKVEPVAVAPKVDAVEPLDVKPKEVAPKRNDRLPVVGPDGMRREIAKLESADAVLLTRELGREWQRVRGIGSTLYTADPLLVLPGYSARIQTASGAEIDLHTLISDTGTTPTHETRAVLNAPSTAFDADLTLLGGRMILRSTKATPLTVRIRFGKLLPESGPAEVWDIVLPDNKSEVGIELKSDYAPGIPLAIEPGNETPRQDLTLSAIRGTMSVRATDTADFPQLRVGQVLTFDGLNSNPTLTTFLRVGSVSFADTIVTPNASFRALMESALKDLDKRLAPREIRISVSLSTAFAESKASPARRMLAMEAMQAMEDFGDLIDALESGTAETRTQALELLRHAIGEFAERDRIVLDALKKGRNFADSEAVSLIQLLHTFDADQGGDMRTIAELLERMKSPRIAVREAAFWWMKKLDPKVEKDISASYSSLGKDAALTASTARWLQSWTKRNAK